MLTVAEPRGKIPFVNVTYAGFVGSVTGMNAERISIGEMGGGGLGHWDGVPMAFLVRMVLEEADSLERGIAIFRKNPRTCEYYFVIADGKTGKAVGMEASWDTIQRDRHGREPSQAAARRSKTPSCSRPATAIRNWSSASKRVLALSMPSRPGI